jgi:hypothetical protein
MGRPPKFQEPSEVVCMRIPESILNQIPKNVKPGDFFLSLLDSKPIALNPSTETAISPELKDAIKIITDFFTIALDIPDFLGLVTPEIEEAIGIMEKI